MQAGNRIKTPRFLEVQIAAIFADATLASECGFDEPTHYDDDPECEIFGRFAGVNRMIFAAAKKNG